MPSRQLAHSLATAGAVTRWAGAVAIAALALCGSGAPWLLAMDDLVVRVGVLLVAVFLWLVLTGAFGYAGAARGDWPALLAFIAALAIRALWARHSVQEIEIQFAHGPVGRHSVVYPLLQLFFAPWVADPQAFTMSMNGLLGAVACLGMYQFVRLRLASRTAGFLCALFLALHPLVARFSPTDGPYALLLAAWFCGLALLSTRPLSGRGLFGGAALLGIAATTRMEGGVILIASLLLLDLRSVVDGARRAAETAVAAGVVVGTLIAVQMAVLLPLHLGGPTSLSALLPKPDLLFGAVISPASYNTKLFNALMWIGALAGVVSRVRLGSFGFLAMLLVLAPVADSWLCGPLTLHRMIPACALQALVAGIGAYVLTAWLPLAAPRRWLAVVPGVAAAAAILAAQREELTRPYVFTQEYDLVRAHLSSAGMPPVPCTLLAFNAVPGNDVDLHDLTQVVPEMRVLDCRQRDCAAEAAQASCVYYMRSAGAYFHADGVPPVCIAAADAPAPDPRVCLDAASAAFERAVALQPIDVQTLDLVATFPDRRANYPTRAAIGLFRVMPSHLPAG